MIVDDQELWARIRRHDGDAFAQLYRRHAGRVYAHLLQRVASRHDAEDLTAEVFIVAWNRAAKVRFGPTAGMLPWLLVCANNLLRNRRRSLHRARRALEKVTRVDEPDPAEQIVDDAEHSANLVTLRTVLGQLSVADQNIIQLCVVQGLSPQTVAETLGKPSGTIRSQLSRALGRAREIYAKHDLRTDSLPTRSAT